LKPDDFRLFVCRHLLAEAAASLFICGPQSFSARPRWI